MRRAWILLVFILISALSGCATEESVEETRVVETVVTYAVPLGMAEIVRVSGGDVQEMPGSIKQLAQTSQLVVTGHFTDNTRQTVTQTYNEALGRWVLSSCRSTNSFTVDRVIRGDASEGDAITIEQDYAYLEDENKLVSYSGLTPMNKGEKWIYFLNYDKENDCYCANYDAAGRYPLEYEDVLDYELGIYDEFEAYWSLRTGAAEYVSRRDVLFSVDPKRFGFRTSSSYMKFKTAGTLPDTYGQETFIEEGDEETISYSPIYVPEAPNMKMAVPKGWYCYEIPGEYYNEVSEERVRLEFVNEYVFTNREVTKEQLTEDLRGTGSPDYVMYSYRVFLKDYLPIENLFMAVNGSSGEYYLKDNYCVGLGNIRTDISDADKEKVKSLIRGVLATVQKTGIECSTLGDADYGDRLNLLIYGNKSMFQTGAGSYITTRYYGLDEGYGGVLDDRVIEYDTTPVLPCGNPDVSVLNDNWWKDYNNAQNQFRILPDKYKQPELDLNADRDMSVHYDAEDAGGLTAAEQALIDNDRILRSGWDFSGEGVDILRAFAYASLKQYDSRITLNDVAVITKTLSNGVRLFGVLQLDDNDPYGFKVIQFGVDMLSQIDLEFARRYAQEYLISESKERKLKSEITAAIDRRLIYGTGDITGGKIYMVYDGELYRGQQYSAGPEKELLYAKYGDLYGSDELFRECLAERGIETIEPELRYMEGSYPKEDGEINIAGVKTPVLYASEEYGRLVLEYAADGGAWRVQFYNSVFSVEDYSHNMDIAEGDIYFTEEGICNPSIAAMAEMSTARDLYMILMGGDHYLETLSDTSAPDGVMFMKAYLSEDRYMEFFQPKVEFEAGRFERIVIVVHYDGMTKYFYTGGLAG